MITRRRTAYGMWMAAAGVGVVVLAACGGSSSGGKASLAAGPGAAPASSATTVSTHTGALGTYLSDSKGRTLYEFANDMAGTSTCSGSCATYWPPLVTSGTPTAGKGVSAAQLTTTKRSDGTLQVSYAGHPLYYFVKDDAAGDTYGQGINSSGGLWWMVAPSGTIIKSSGAAKPSSGGYSSNGY